MTVKNIECIRKALCNACYQQVKHGAIPETLRKVFV